MGPRKNLAGLVGWSLMIPLFVAGCAWEFGGSTDAGGLDGTPGGDTDTRYPSGPYGAEVGDTVENFRVEQCICSGIPAQSKGFYLENFLGSKAILVTVHTGSCPFCEQQALTMQNDVYLAFQDQGLKILLVLIGDDYGNASRQTLLNFCCDYKLRYGMTFVVAADPDVAVMSDYVKQGTPLNMLLDKNMEIRYRVEALLPDTLLGNIDNLLKE